MKVQQTFYVEKELLTDLKIVCAKLGVTRSQYLTDLVTKDIKRIKENVSRETDCKMRFLNYDNICITDCDIENCGYRKEK